MKKTLILCAAALLAGMHGLNAQVKILERSASKAPEWIGITQPDYVIVSAEDATLDGARQRCLTDIRQAVVNAVAVNVSSEETSSEAQDRYNLSTSVYGSYESQVRTVAARLPFLTGITLSKAETYWEKCLDKKQKRTYYVCHVKYPFSRFERRALIGEFLRQDGEQYAKLQALKQNLDTFDRVEYIDRALTELEPLIAYFFDDVRRNEAEALRRAYIQAYGRISAVPYENDLGSHLFYLSLDGRRVTTSNRPRVTSPCATEVNVVPTDDGMYRVEYAYGNCIDEDQGTVELTYRFGSRVLRHSFFFDARSRKMSVVPYGEIELDAVADGEGTGNCRCIEVRIPLRSKYDGAFEVVSVDFTAEGIGSRIRCDVHARFEGKGNHRLVFVAEQPTTIGERRAALAQGIIELRNLQTGASEQVRLNLPYKITVR